MTKQFLKIGALIGAAAFALILVAGMHATSGTAHASAPSPTPTANPNEIEVDTSAQVVGGGGSAPIVDAKWELPDMEPAVGGFQYCSGFSGCHTDLNGNGINDADDDPLTSGMQMAPNLCDEAPVGTPSERAIQYWIVAEDKDGLSTITAAWDKVWEPVTQEGTCLDGSTPVSMPNTTQLFCFKYQVDPDEMQCSDLGTFDSVHNPSITTLSPALAAAVDTGQLTQAQAELLVQRCYKHEVRVWRGTKTLAHHQPAGTYVVKAYAEDGANNVGMIWNLFTVLPVIGLRIDFDLVDWAGILPSVDDTVSGNEILDGPHSTSPTVKDCGNVNMSLTLEYSPMVNTTDPTEAITSFDANFMGQELQFAADQEQTFTHCYIPCHPKELDLSIHPPEKLPPGLYQGDLDVTGGVCINE